MTASGILRIRAALGQNVLIARGWPGQGLLGKAHKMQGGVWRVWQESSAYTTAPLAAVPANMASSPMAKRAMNQTKPVALAGGSQKAAMTAKKPITAPQPVQHTTCSQYIVPVRIWRSRLARCMKTGADRLGPGKRGQGGKRVTGWESVLESFNGCGKMKGNLGEQNCQLKVLQGNTMPDPMRSKVQKNPMWHVFFLFCSAKGQVEGDVVWWAYMTAPTGAVPAKIASSPTAKMSMNHTKPAVVAGGIQKAATIATKPTTALMPAAQHSIRQTMAGNGVC